jgi:hypothetical protein
VATISNAKDLLPLLETIEPTIDPVTALERRGHTLSDAVKTRLKSGRAPTPAQLQLWTKAALKAGRSRITVGQAPALTPRSVSPNEFEFSAGVRMSAANEILNGVFANGTIPNELFLDELLSSSDSARLQSLFRVDPPGGRIGRLFVTGPPTVAQIGEGLDRVLLTIPFRLNFERIISTVFSQSRVVVTFATGVMKLGIKVVAETSTDSRGGRNVVIQLDLSQRQEARLEVDPQSPVQLVSPPAQDQVDLVAAILQGEIQKKLGGSLRLSLSATIPLPFGRLEIARVVILTRSNAILVGMKVVGTPGSGDPDTLVPLFPNSQANLFTRVHDQVLRFIIQDAAKSGVLTQAAKKTHPDAVIDSADIAFGPNTIKLIAKGRIVDLCPFNVDLGFTVTTTLTIKLTGTEIRVEKETSKDLDNGDAALCALGTLAFALFAAVAVVVFNGIGIASGIAAVVTFGVIGVLSVLLAFDSDDFALAFGSGGDNKPTILELDFPIPGTDLLPTLTGNFLRLDESTMLMAAHLGTRADRLNTYFYVRFMEPDSRNPAATVTRPMRGARVRLIDKDFPPPAGDDVTLPGPSTAESIAHATSDKPISHFKVTTRTHFERTADETFRDLIADRNGRIRIYIPRDKLLSNAGRKVVETTRLNLDTDKETTSVMRTPVSEARPDFFFRLTRTDGTSVDTLQLESGFFKNFQSARVGTPTNPLTITFGSVGPIVVDPG